MKIPTVSRAARGRLTGLALLIVVTGGAPAAADPFTFLQPGFQQEVYATASGFFGGVAFVPNGDPLVVDCKGANSPVLRFNSKTVTIVNQTPVHPLASTFASVVGCGITNHPNGGLYASTKQGVARLDIQTLATVAGPFGGPANTLSITVDPQTNRIVYASLDGSLRSVDAALTNQQLVSAALTGNGLDGLTYDPSGQFLLAAVHLPAPGLAVLRRDGTPAQFVPTGSDPDGIAFHISNPRFVVTVNLDGTLTRFDFPGDNLAQPPVQSVFAAGGFRGDLCQVGADGALYLTQDGTRFNDGLMSADNSLVRIGGGFAPGPGNQPPRFLPPTPADDSTLHLSPGQTATFAVVAGPGGAGGAAGPDPTALVKLDTTTPLPPGAIQNPALPVVGNPAASTFTWVPSDADVGQFVVTYRATTQGGLTAFTSVTIVVESPADASAIIHLYAAGGRRVATAILRRTASGGFTGRFRDLHPGTYTARATRYAEPNLQGRVTATGEGKATVRPDRTVQLVLRWVPVP